MTNRPLHIVCHAFPSWRGDYVKSTIQLMKELAVHHKVLYIDYAYSWKDVLLNTRHNKHIPVKRILGLTYPVEKVKLENGGVIYVLSLPPIIPFNWIDRDDLIDKVLNVNRGLINRRIKSALKKLKMEEPVVINAFNPFFNSIDQKAFKQKATLYYCYDNIAASNWASKHGPRLENELINKADALIFTSDTLLKTKGVNNKPAFVIHNGVDLSLFEAAMQRNPRPIGETPVRIGYVGSIDDRLDYILLEKIIQEKPHWEFDFVGRILDNHAEPLKKYANVKFYGSVPLPELPDIIREFSAGIIPFVKNEFTKNIYPMKANEYLALGLPVIMTDFADIDDLADVVARVPAEQFHQKLEQEIATDSFDKKAIRKEKAMNNSWKNQAAKLEKIIREYA
jgi:glycosyltransferase involved in cell wall biosynthesis